MKDKFTEGTIEALGHGEVFAAPDEAIVTFEIVTQAETAAQAVADNAAITQTVIDAVSEEPNHGVTTTGLSVWPVHQYDPETNLDTIVGFRATNGVRVRTKPGFAGQVDDAGIEAGANVSSGILFRIEDETPLRAEALERAVAHAFKEAEIVVNAADLDLLGVRAIVIDPMMGPVYVSAEKIDADAVMTPVMPEDLSVQANVRVIFRMK